MAKFTNRLRVLRADKRKSQIDTATAAKISEGRYWRIENGYLEPTPSERNAIAAALGVAVSEAFPQPVADEAHP